MKNHNWEKCRHSLTNKKEYKLYGLITRVLKSCPHPNKKKRKEDFYTIWKNDCDNCTKCEILDN